MNIQLTEVEKLDIRISTCKDVKKFLACKDIDSQVKWLESHLIELKSQTKSEINRLESLIRLERVKEIGEGVIKKYFKEEFGISNLKGASKDEIEAKHYSMYALRKMCKFSFYDIRDIFKLKNHTTVTNAVNKIQGWIDLEDKEALRMTKEVQLLINKI